MEKIITVAQEHDKIRLFAAENAREIFIDKGVHEKVRIFRKVDNDPWLFIAEDAPSPFIDKDDIKGPATIEYEVVVVDENGKEVANQSFKISLFNRVEE